MGKRRTPNHEIMGNSKYLFWYYMGEKKVSNLKSVLKVIYTINNNEHNSYS